MTKLGRRFGENNRLNNSPVSNLQSSSNSTSLSHNAGAPRKGAHRRYGFAVLAVGIALLPKLIAPIIGGTSSFLPFILAVMVSAWYGGMLPGLLATLLSCILINYFWEPPIGTLSVNQFVGGLPLFQFVLVGMSISWLSDQLHAARRRAEAIAQEARHHQAALWQSEVRARESSRRMMEILESISDAFFSVDLEWRFTYVNREAERLWGKGRDTLLGKVMWEEFPQIVGLTPYQKFHEAIQAQQAVEFETLSVILNKWVEVNAYPADEGLTVYFRDISDRKATEAILHNSEERLRLALEGADLGMWDYDLTSGQLEWTARCKALFDLALDTAISYEVFLNAVYPDDRQRVNQAVEESIAAGQNFDIEYRSQWGNGTIHWIAAKGQTFCNESGEPMRMVGVVLDVTDRKQLEESLRQQTQALEQANHFKDDFLAIVSHELRAPLSAILGWAQILRSRPVDPVTTAQALETIERNARSQSQLITDLLDISRLTRGKVRFDLRPLVLASVVHAAIEAMRPSAEAKQIQLSSTLNPEVELVLGDPERLQQVIWNLLSNAIKFTAEGGRVEVTLQQIDTYAQIQVIDTGKGISADVLPHIFEQFYQVDGSIAASQDGLGLGLAIVRQLVELHGGTIAVASPGAGQGSTFTVNLPLLTFAPTAEVAIAGVPIASQESITSAEPSLAGLRALVIDDEEDARELLIALLEAFEVEVIATASGTEACETLPLFKPDVIICDIGMPREDGYTVIRKIRALPTAQGGRTPAIALTSYARQEDRQQAKQAGFQQHLPKPLNADDLFRAIGLLTGRSLD